MKNRIYESMTRVQLTEFTIRVWATETAAYPGPRMEIVEAIHRISPRGSFFRERIIETLDAFPDVSAYEILDAQGNGCIVYPDWK